MRRGYRRDVKHVVPWLIAWIAVFWLWMLLVGDWNRIEWIGGASAATVAATVGEIARTAAGVRGALPLGWVARARTVPVMIVVDFGIIVWALAASLVRRRVVRGEFRAHPFPAGGSTPEDVGIRAWANLVANYSPNSYIVDIGDETLVHYLVPFRKSSEPA
jgi:hypothetical protein